MNTITRNDIEGAIQSSDVRPFRVIWDGELVLLCCPKNKRLFVYNRNTRQAFEIAPDYQTGVRVDVR